MLVDLFSAVYSVITLQGWNTRGNVSLTDLVEAALRWKYGDVSVETCVWTAGHFLSLVVTSDELRGTESFRSRSCLILTPFLLDGQQIWNSMPVCSRWTTKGIMVLLHFPERFYFLFQLRLWGAAPWLAPLTLLLDGNNKEVEWLYQLDWPFLSAPVLSNQNEKRFVRDSGVVEDRSAEVSGGKDEWTQRLRRPPLCVWVLSLGCWWPPHTQPNVGPPGRLLSQR